MASAPGLFSCISSDRRRLRRTPRNGNIETMDCMKRFRERSVPRVVSASVLTSIAALAWVGLPAAAATGAASGPTGASAPFVHHGAAPTKKAAPAATVKPVDINSAGRKELKSLPGIGDAEAEKIIANRPYRTKADLVGKNVLPVGPYLSLKNQIIALPKGKAKGKSPPPNAAKQGS
jgi:competence protein ComEA